MGISGHATRACVSRKQCERAKHDVDALVGLYLAEQEYLNALAPGRRLVGRLGDVIRQQSVRDNRYFIIRNADAQKAIACNRRMNDEMVEAMQNSVRANSLYPRARIVVEWIRVVNGQHRWSDFSEFVNELAVNDRQSRPLEMDHIRRRSPESPDQPSH